MGSNDADGGDATSTTIAGWGAAEVDNADASSSGGISSDDDSSGTGATVGYVFLVLFIIGGLVGGVIYARKNRLKMLSLSSCFGSGSKTTGGNHTPFQISNPMYGGASRSGAGSSTLEGLDGSVA